MPTNDQIEKLKAHITLDPEVAGYDGMSDAEVLVELKAEDKTLIKQTLPASDVFGAIVQS